MSCNRKVRKLLRRAADLLEQPPAYGPQISVGLALLRAHKELNKYWGYLPVAKTAILDQLRQDNYTIPIEEWENFSGESGKAFAPILRASAYQVKVDDENQYLE